MSSEIAIAFGSLADTSRWLAWQPETRGGKPTKVPYAAVGNGRGKANDPATWGTLTQAARRARRLGPAGAVGIVLGDLGGDAALFGIDLDASLDPKTGEAAPWARTVLDLVATYAEISPSGCGLKAFGYVPSEHVRPLLDRLGVDPDKYGTKRSVKGAAVAEHGEAIELYCGGRYFATTGVLWPGCPETVRWVDARALATLVDHVLAVTVPPRTNTVGNGHDTSRSAAAYRRMAALRRNGASFDEAIEILEDEPETSDWVAEKGHATGDRELKRIWAKVAPDDEASGLEDWGDPDLDVLRQHRRPPPPLPIDIFGPWGEWIERAAAAAACPADYVMAPLIACVSVLIGHARWPQATAGWSEPPHLWAGAVGDSGNGKSPGADCLMRDVLPAIERKMAADFPDQLRDWQAASAFAKAAEERWQSEVRDAEKMGRPPPLPPVSEIGPEPQLPRLRQHDVTIERVATLLATAAPKGVLIVRDELSGWIAGMNVYNDSGRAFWIESYGGRPFRVERQRREPIDIPRLAVAVYGSTQPDKLAELMQQPDDGLLSRILWTWPEPTPFRLGQATPNVPWAIEALDRLRELGLQAGSPPHPIAVSLDDGARGHIERFGREMQERQTTAGGLLRSAFGKARGLALRLSLVIEMLWWCGASGMSPPPSTISARAFAGAARLLADYFLVMAERVYGDAAATAADRNAATLARWIVKTHPAEVHVREVLRRVRLPGLAAAGDVHAAAKVLVEAGWLTLPPKGARRGRAREAYTVKPRLWELIS